MMTVRKTMTIYYVHDDR